MGRLEPEGILTVRSLMSNDPLRNFADEYRKHKADPIKQLEIKFELLTERLNRLEAAIWQKLDQKDELDEMHATAIKGLKDDLALMAEALREHIAERHDHAGETEETVSLLLEYRRKLRALQRQEAQYGADVPLHIVLEIEKTESRIDQLQQEIGR